ncbi:MAG: hypothetical protein O7E56_03255 [SAR324 cluster bacterium]|nr:hypothetical protein [SAR324 cluster bacterium]MCZ6728869.1 hypothetical protein [SAR324 cluster bacterium]
MGRMLLLAWLLAWLPPGMALSNEIAEGPWEWILPSPHAGSVLHGADASVAAPRQGVASLEEGGQAPRDFDLLFYGGKFNDNTFRKIIFNQETEYRDSYVWVAGLNYKLGKFMGPVTVETEGLLAKHTGLQDQWEADLLILIRQQWVWENSFSFSMAIGDGFSIASKTPRLEREENSNAKVLLQFLMVEFDFGLPSIRGWPRFMMRIHHRSGVFGTFCPRTCGSNFVTYGFKYAF